MKPRPPCNRYIVERPRSGVFCFLLILPLLYNSVCCCCCCCCWRKKESRLLVVSPFHLSRHHFYFYPGWATKKHPTAPGQVDGGPPSIKYLSYDVYQGRETFLVLLLCTYPLVPSYSLHPLHPRVGFSVFHLFLFSFFLFGFG